jgi:CheY-like chemotaxis protein
LIYFFCGLVTGLICCIVYLRLSSNHVASCTNQLERSSKLALTHNLKTLLSVVQHQQYSDPVLEQQIKRTLSSCVHSLSLSETNKSIHFDIAREVEIIYESFYALAQWKDVGIYLELKSNATATVNRHTVHQFFNIIISALLTKCEKGDKIQLTVQESKDNTVNIALFYYSQGQPEWLLNSKSPLKEEDYNLLESSLSAEKMKLSSTLIKHSSLTYTISVPITKDAEMADVSSPVFGSDNEKVLLLIDDSLAVLTTFGIYFGEHFKVITAQNGEEGIEKLGIYDPVIIVCDIMMPGKYNGLDVLNYIKNSKQFNHIPTLMFSAMTDIDTQEKAYQLDSDDFISKDEPPEIVLSKVQAKLSATHSEIEKACFDLITDVNDVAPEVNVDIHLSEDFAARQFINSLIFHCRNLLPKGEINLNMLAYTSVGMTASQASRKLATLTNGRINALEQLVDIERLHTAKKLIQQGASTVDIESAVGIKLEQIKALHIAHFGSEFT